LEQKVKRAEELDKQKLKEFVEQGILKKNKWQINSYSLTEESKGILKELLGQEKGKEIISDLNEQLRDGQFNKAIKIEGQTLHLLGILNGIKDTKEKKKTPQAPQKEELQKTPLGVRLGKKRPPLSTDSLFLAPTQTEGQQKKISELQKNLFPPSISFIMIFTFVLKLSVIAINP